MASSETQDPRCRQLFQYPGAPGCGPAAVLPCQKPALQPPSYRRRSLHLPAGPLPAGPLPPIMALQAVQPQSPQGAASNQGDSAGDHLDDDVSDLGRSSTSSQCSLDHDDSWMAPHDKMVLLQVLSPQQSGLKTCGNPPQHRLRRLPTHAEPAKLIGEGAANVVFELNCPGFDLKGLLLRVAKVPPDSNHAPPYNYVRQQYFYQASIKPLLGEYAVQQELVILRKSGIVAKLNKFLRDNIASRKDRFKNSYIGQTDWGLLVEDMRPQNPDEYVLVEFKPKWLSQSPSAPNAAIRCRQCAMELRNLVTRPDDRPLPEDKPCPLTLANDAPSQVSSPFRIAPQLRRDGHFQTALRSIADHSAIRDLRLQQERHDLHGPLYAQSSDRSFIIAMTLRDCTCFAQIHRRHQLVKLRMGDFDRKDPEVKLEHWRKAEEELINGGFYTAQLIMCGGSFYHTPTRCALEYSSQDLSKRPEILNIQELRKRAQEPNTLVESKKIFNHEIAADIVQKVQKRLEIAASHSPATAVHDLARNCRH